MSVIEPVLELHNLSKSYELDNRSITPLYNVTASIPGGAFIAITGPSGTGKSTLLRLLTRLEDPDSGHVVYRGRPLTEWEPTELRRRLHYVFQNPVLFPGTVADNITYPARLTDQTLADDTIHDLLTRVALPPSYANRTVEDLSGGEKQRVNLARSLSLCPNVLLLDEPTSALDEESTAHIEAEVTAYCQQGNTIIWITHSTEQAKRIADRIWQIENGQLTEVVLR
ncbi:phosphate ABC transporter ATP-binding protein (PhoT family) [Aneurinibacillus soli]|uniref:Putative ABC transporter ATP-binding protein YbbL n=1 Tax=Aneurinibacillus soli TaxID=1500254 RepID=A0A0U4WF19_9BACL|nr:ATP-binding cassette domain-containing protein [Aneurinibacillus soli]PYE63728.1 phosphate ABC transporter ATP-binding protein (PhoT family) [Aneurinibacillus soli]BAU27339.1 putative ABC transporter ATP-binding protein YbbL [Aneurinibacillus soli]